MNILIIGANGQVGRELVSAFADTAHSIIATTRLQLDCTDNEIQIHHQLSLVNPDLIINAAAYTAVDKAEDEPELAYQINATFVKYLATYCAKSQIPLLHFSTDYVFDGAQSKAYQEDDPPNPLNVYGRSKLAGEQHIVSSLTKYLILRASWVFGVHGNNFVKTILKLASQKEELAIVADQWGKPTAAKDIARVVLILVTHLDQPGFSSWGIYHYAGRKPVSWHAFAKFFLAMAQQRNAYIAAYDVRAISTKEYPAKAPRPKNSILDTSRIEQVFGVTAAHWADFLPETLDAHCVFLNGYSLSVAQCIKSWFRKTLTYPIYRTRL